MAGEACRPTWRDKAERIIAEESYRAYRASNYRGGKKLKRHVPYSVPPIVEQLVVALGKNDEVGAKTIFQEHAFFGAKSRS